ncbi:hypothetical protein FRC12_005271 [Ceratobasidium sp. 428]|nr:hypothetical protein FRC12_005271 [Ceratobasidium sp. 428]
MVVIGYLPTDSFSEVDNQELRRQYRGDLLHRSLEKIFEPLKTASSNGLLAWCADGYLRHIYPVVASWIADWPEQNNLACTTQGGCPKCMQGWKGRGDRGLRAPPRDPDDTLEALKAYKESKKPAVLTALRLRAVEPFWDGIPHMDIGSCFTPDLLHQLYKGMFEHARNWVEDLLGTKEFNKRFKIMPGAKDLRHFKNGVTTVKNWAGRESRDMMRQFLPIVVDAQAPASFVRMIRALLDFSYIAHSARLTDTDLEELDSALSAFHETKNILLTKKMVKDDGFNRIAKLHMLSHYVDDIRELGAPDGYSSETPEYLHIVYAKVPWRMSNRRNPFPQIVKYVRRLEAIHVQRTAIDEYYGEREGADKEEIRLALRLLEEEDEKKKKCQEENAHESEPESDSESEVESGSESESNVSSDEDSEEGVGSESEAPAIVSNPAYYPRPSIALARQPTARRVPGHVLISSYGCADLIRVVRTYLLSKTGRKPLLLLPTDRFDVWHKATLHHSPLPFAPCEPRHRDVVRVRPTIRDKAGRVGDPGLFDTALFATDDGFGIARFRAGRVRAIFTLPPHLRYLCSKPLVFLDTYTPFSADPTHSHHLYRVTPSHLDGTHAAAALVLPLTSIAMACHLAPDFSSPRLDQHLLNHYYNHFTFLLMVHWRRLHASRST